MNKKKTALLIAAVFIVLLIGAYALYSALGESYAPEVLTPGESAAQSGENAQIHNSQSQENDGESEKAPDFTVYNLNGEPVKLSEADVEKVGPVFVLKADKSIVVDARSFKMSKSRGNVVNPDDIIAKYGADALRLYEMFLGPLEDQKPWNTNGIEGVWRFLKKVWREYVDAQDGSLNRKISASTRDSNELLKLLNQTIIKVGADIENLRFNTAISQMMIYVGMLQKQQSVSLDSAAKFVQLLAPFAPHISEELWARLGMKGSVAKAPWPKADESKICNDTHKIAVQVNGKLRGELQIDASMGKDDILTAAKNIENVKNFTDKKTIVKEIYVPNKIVNIVVK